MVAKVYRFLTVVIFFVLPVAGCSTANIGNTKIDDIGRYMQLRPNESNKRDVYLLFGQPHYVAYSGQLSSWVYKKVALTTSGWTFVPVVGLFAGGANKEEKVTVFNFTENGILTNSSTDTSSGYLNMWVGVTGNGLNDDKPSNSSPVEDEMNKLGFPYNDQISK